nr:MAG TPA: hypothetical protein [Caudoviricetes sp.]
MTTPFTTPTFQIICPIMKIYVKMSNPIIDDSTLFEDF